ncbi:hypothetical protein [Namhaeicola litoreus]|uniref:Uncharacterized protein n=1 Tax=Namhaeicola litoreus TaxID=1052145 RepID=A0ABW3XZP1_9FLAO
MNVQKILECEREQLQKIKFLPYHYKKFGFVLLIISLISLAILTFTDYSSVLMNNISKSALLVSLLLISISMEKNEDEYTMQLRARSYVMAFIFGVVYAILQPYINYVVALFVKREAADFKELSSFVIIWFMLFIQLGFYYTLRRTR